MAMQKIKRKGGSSDSSRVKLENVGDKIEGIYEGSDSFQYNEKTIKRYTFKNSSGVTSSILGTFQLDEDMPQVPEGAFARITLVGFKKLKSGGKLKEYDIEFEAVESL